MIGYLGKTFTHSLPLDHSYVPEIRHPDDIRLTTAFLYTILIEHSKCIRENKGLKMDYLIREAKEQDYKGNLQLYDEIALLHARALPQIFIKADMPFWNKEYISGIIESDNSVIFIAESDNTIIGLIEVEIRESPDIPIMVKRRYAYVDTIVVAETFRHTGIGKDLMRQVEKWALEKDISQIEFNVWDFNQNAMGFFNKLGYSPSRHIMWKVI